MFIRAYLRASTEDQFADRAKEMLGQFVQERGHKIASSGGRVLYRLCSPGSDWITLKKQIEQHELRIVAWMYPPHGRRCQIKTLRRLTQSPAP